MYGPGAPHQAEAASCFLIGRKGDDRSARPVFGDEARGEAGFSEYHDDAHMKFLSGVANGFSDSFVDVQLGGARWARLIGHAGFGFANNAVHHGHRLDRVAADGRFAGEHQRVAAIENGVGHVGSFGAGGPRALRHRIEHLCSSDDGHERIACVRDDLLLHNWHFFGAHFNAEIAASDHDAIGDSQNFIEIIDRFGFFDLGDERRVFAVASDSRFGGANVIGRSARS